MNTARYVFACGITALMIGTSPQVAHTAEPAEIEYRGRTLIGSTYSGADNAEFFRIARKAIDLVDTLPNSRWNNTSAVKVIRYNPPSADRPDPGVFRHLVGVYSKGNGKRERGQLIVFRQAGYSSPLQIALGMTNSGIYIREGRGRFELQHLARNKTARLGLECKADIASWHALRYLHPRSREIRQRAILLRERGCWEQERQKPSAAGQRTALSRQ